MVIKIFRVNSIQDLETQFYEWLAKTPDAEILAASQSESDSSEGGWWLTFTVLYNGRHVHMQEGPAVTPIEGVSTADSKQVSVKKYLNEDI
jgi:hypothetical protein